MSDLQEVARTAAQLLDLWADALRGDWGSIDGRSCRMQLNDISAYLRGDTATPPKLYDLGLCTIGGSVHWFGEGWGHNCASIFEVSDDE